MQDSKACSCGHRGSPGTCGLASDLIWVRKFKQASGSSSWYMWGDIEARASDQGHHGIWQHIFWDFGTCCCSSGKEFSVRIRSQARLSLERLLAGFCPFHSLLFLPPALPLHTL